MTNDVRARRKYGSRSWQAALACALLCVLLGASAWAEQGGIRRDDEVSRLTHEVSQEVFSPFCPGKTLSMCPSGNAAEVRRDIQELARQGMEKEAIKESIIARYGEQFRLVEPAAEDNMKLVVGLGLGLLLAVAAVVVLTRRQRTDEATGGVSEQSEEAPGAENQEEELLSDLRDDYLN